MKLTKYIGPKYRMSGFRVGLEFTPAYKPLMPPGALLMDDHIVCNPVILQSKYIKIVKIIHLLFKPIING